MSSTQPISTSRSPVIGSRPVVSVSNTISRMPLSRPGGGESAPLRHLSNSRKDAANLIARRLDAMRAIHHEIGPPALLGVRHLTRQQRLELLGAQPALERAGALHLRR